MKIYALIFTTLLSTSLLAQSSRDTLSGTMVIEKSTTFSKEVLYVESDYAMSTDKPIAVNLRSKTNSIVQYALLAKAFDKRYKRVSEFQLKISKSDSIIILFSDSKLVTQDMLDALSRMQKEGGKATFYAIKIQRSVGIVNLPSFNYEVPKPRSSRIKLPSTTQG